MAYKLQHLSLGGVLDQGIAITRDNFRLLISIMLVLNMPFLLVLGFITQSSVPQPPPANSTPGETVHYTFAVFGQLPYVLIGLAAYTLVVLPLTKAMIIQAVTRLYLGQPVTLMETIKLGLHQFFPLLVTSTLMWIPIWIGFVFCLVPGVILYLLFGLSQIVTVVEGAVGPAALARSYRLAGPNWLTFLGLMAIIVVITYILQVMPNLIPQLHLRVLVSTVISSALAMWSTATIVVFYFSCRCAQEHFDLHYLAESIGVEPVVAQL